jgi:pilus assembly protein CpaE
MARSPTVVIIGAKQDDERLLRQQLDGAFEIEGVEPEPQKGLELVKRTSPSIVLLYLDHAREAILDASAKLAQTNGSAAVIVSRDRNPDNILHAMRAGAKDFAFLEEEGLDVRRVALNLSFRPATPAPSTEARRANMVAIFGCKGGSGSTTIATNLAGALLPQGPKPTKGQVVLLDLDLQMGDVLTFLDLTSRYTWRDLVQNLHRLDADLLHQSLTVHPSGLHIVAQADAVADADLVDAKSIAGVLGFLRKNFEWVVIDGLRDFSEISLIALDLADKILLTMTQDIPALKNASRCLAIFRQLGFGRDKVKIVLNRYQKRSDLDADTIADALGAPVDATISNDFPMVIRAMNEGSMLVALEPRSPVSKDIRALVPLLRGEPPDKAGLLGRLGKR